MVPSSIYVNDYLKQINNILKINKKQLTYFLGKKNIKSLALFNLTRKAVQLSELDFDNEILKNNFLELNLRTRDSLSDMLKFLSVASPHILAITNLLCKFSLIVILQKLQKAKGKKKQNETSQTKESPLNKKLPHKKYG